MKYRINRCETQQHKLSYFVLSDVSVSLLLPIYTSLFTIKMVVQLIYNLTKKQSKRTCMMLDIPRTTTSLGDREFAVAGPRVWNSLPPAIRDPSLSPSVFGKLLKTYLFV